MTMTRFHLFDETLQKSEAWMSQLQNDMHTADPQHAYSALRSVLHALRDRLITSEAVDLSAQLPLLIKGIYFDGWKPADKPVKLSNVSEFLDYVETELIDVVDTHQAVSAVFKLLGDQISSGEIADVRSNLPDSLQLLWKTNGS